MRSHDIIIMIITMNVDLLIITIGIVIVHMKDHSIVNTGNDYYLKVSSQLPI